MVSLYNLSKCTITYEEINNIPYLINISKGKGYEVGLRTKIPNELLKDGNPFYNNDKESYEIQQKIISTLESKLFFNSYEILFTNILLDKYLSSENYPNISFKEIEINYRRKSIANRNIIINDYTYNRYIETISSLKEKEVYLKTNNSFRNAKYGVNNRHFNHNFLTIISDCKIGSNNIEFSYSFGAFGNVLKLSRRFSNILPAVFYQCSFNQISKHVLGYYFAQKIFFHQYRANFNDTFVGYDFKLNVNSLLDEIPYNGRKKELKGYSFQYVLNNCKQEPNKIRIYRLAIKTLKKMLDIFCSYHIISSYHLDFELNENEQFEKDHEFDVWASDERDYILNENDVGKYLFYTILTVNL